MWVKVIVLLLVVDFSCGFSLAMTALEVGKPFELRLGKVVNWKRVRWDADVEEFIKYCGPKAREPICTQFVTKDGKPSKPITKAHVKKDGTLVIESLKESDGGVYSSPDQKSTNEPPSQIELEVGMPQI